MVQKLYRHGTVSVPSWKSDFSIPVTLRNFTPVQKFFTMKAIYNNPHTPPQYFMSCKQKTGLSNKSVR